MSDSMGVFGWLLCSRNYLEHQHSGYEYDTRHMPSMDISTMRDIVNILDGKSDEFLPHFIKFANTIGEASLKFTVSDSAKLSYMLRAFDELVEDLNRYVDFKKLCKQQALNLGFKYNEDKDLYMFPKYLLPCIAEGTEVYNAEGEKIAYTSAIAFRDYPEYLPEYDEFKHHLPYGVRLYR